MSHNYTPPPSGTEHARVAVTINGRSFEFVVREGTWGRLAVFEAVSGLLADVLPDDCQWYGAGGGEPVAVESIEHHARETVERVATAHGVQSYRRYIEALQARAR